MLGQRRQNVLLTCVVLVGLGVGFLQRPNDVQSRHSQLVDRHAEHFEKPELSMSKWQFQSFHLHRFLDAEEEIRTGLK